MMDNHIVIGQIGAPHGVRGEVRVVSLTDFPDRFNGLRKVFVEDKELAIESMKQLNQFILMKFAGLNDRNAVEFLKGKLIKVDRKDAAPLNEGEYYAFDIIGLKVLDAQNGMELGNIVNILKTGSNDVYVVKGAEKEILIPALKSVVSKIDLDNGNMYATLQEEMNSDAD